MNKKAKYFGGIMKVIVNDLFDELEICMPKELQTDTFADEYLKIQNKFNEYPNKKVSVYFQNVIWIDNLAMIQLFLMLWKRKKTKQLIRIFVEITEDNIEYFRFYKYLEDYGFINCIKEIDPFFNEIEVNQSLDFIYNQLSYGNFEQSECLIPFKIIENPNRTTELIQEICDIFSEKYNNEFFDYELQNFIFRMSIFLQETINNVFEHAFQNKEEAFYGIMLRFIHRNNRSDLTERKRDYYILQNEKEASLPFKTPNPFDMQNFTQLECKNNPYRNPTGIKILDRYLQIFVVDAGMGLLESMGCEDPGQERGLLNEIFQRIRSRKKTPKKIRNTLVGGIGMLYQLFQENENYISIKGEYNWTTVRCTKKKYPHETLQYVHKSGITNKNVLKGFAIIGYLDCGYKYHTDYFRYTLTEFQNQVFTQSYIMTEYKELPNISILDFRKDLPDLSSRENIKSTILCFVGTNIEKNIWANKIHTLYNNKSNKKNVLILVDIPDREARKYELIFDGYKGNISKAILVTCGLKISIFTCNLTGRLVYNQDTTSNYVINKSEELTSSGYALLNIIRQYDSQKFWDTVQKCQNENGQKLFINKTINWKANKNYKLHGYLDFSQVVFDENLMTLLMYQLYRLPKQTEKDNYYKSMERFADDLCEKINGKLKIQITDDPKQQINIGSVYVTGETSSMSTFDLEKTQSKQEYYFFRHLLTNDIETKDNNIKALLLWPSESLTDQWFSAQEKTEFARLANTGFLAPKGTEYFAAQHYKSQPSSVKLLPHQNYQSFQSDPFWTKRLLKMAHIDMVDKHDLIYLNAVTLFTKHYMESRYVKKYIEENCFDYLLKKMYYALGRTKKQNFKESVKNDICPEYRLIIEGKINGNDIPEESGLFVYLADYETIEIISKLKGIFSNEVQKRIIPIAPVNKKRTAFPLLISPILLESIRNKINPVDSGNTKQKMGRVTIFIASITSTRLQKELRHILYRLGATEVTSLCLLDRQRFPLGSRAKNSYYSFAKIDLPILGSENRCKLCTGVNILQNLKENLFSIVLKKRCEEIMYIWGKIKSSDSFYGRGVESKRYIFPEPLADTVDAICKQDYGIDYSIEINSDMGLVLFTLEQSTITVSLDFLKRCLESEDIENETKILLISSHLLIFGEDEIVVTDKRILTKKLYSLLQQSNESNAYTALACITLLTQTTTEKKYLHQFYRTQWRLEHFQNIDFIIASIGIMLSASNQQDTLLKYWIKNSKEEQLDYLYGVFLLTDGNAKTRHGTILSRMTDRGWAISEMDYITADNDAAFLETAYKTMPLSYFIDPHAYQDKREKLVDMIKQIRTDLNLAISNTAEVSRNKLAKNISKMFAETKSFNTEIFMNTDITILSKLQDKVNEVAETARERVGRTKMTCYVEQIIYDTDNTDDSNNGKKYFYFIEDLRREIMYLIEDFRHADKHRFMIGSDGQKYTGIVEVIFYETYMSYLFKNYVNDTFSIEEVKRKKKLKLNRPTIMSLRALYPYDQDLPLFDYTYNSQDQIYTAKINIPYLGV